MVVTRVALPARAADGWHPLLARHPALAGATALLLVPEHVMARLGDGVQVEPFVLARAADGLVVIADPGEADESSGPTVSEWLVAASPGSEARLATERLAHVLAVVGLDHASAGVRYGLVRRTAAALLAADAFAAAHAVVLVRAAFDDYAAFVALFGLEARPNELVAVGRAGGRQLHFGWVAGRAEGSAPRPAPVRAARSPDEQLRDQLGAILGGPVDVEASAVFSYGDPVEVLVRADAHAVHVEVPVVEWRGPTPVLTGERRASFPREGVTRLGGDAPFIEAVYTARAERVARFRMCAECGERTPPERMHGESLCTRCAAAL